MTIASQTSRIAYTGDGVTTAFAVPFYFQANADLVATLQDTLGNQTVQVLGTNYNLTGATLSAGGTCTFVTAPTASYLVTVYRDPAVTQTTSYNNNDPFPAKAHELALDKLTTIAQRLKDQISRTIHQTEGEAAMTTALATVATRKNKLFGFGTSGELIYPLGPTFVAGTYVGVADVDSRATAAITTFPISINVVRTAGYAAPGDGGGWVYKRGLSTSPGAFQDAGAVWWGLDLSSGIVRARWFGAVGDGATNDSAALLRWVTAVNATTTTSVTAILGAGNFQLASATVAASPIAWTRSNITIEGEGGTITVTGTAVTANLLSSNDQSHIHYKNLNLYGNSQADAFANGGAIGFTNSTLDITDLLVEDCTFTNFKGDYWIYVETLGTFTKSIQNITVNRNTFMSLTGNCRGPTTIGINSSFVLVYGVDTDGTATNAFVKSVRITNNHMRADYIKTGVQAFYYVQDILISGNQIYNTGQLGGIIDDNGSYAILLYGSSPLAKHAVVENNFIFNPRDNGVYMVGRWPDSVINGNVIDTQTSTATTTLPKGGISINSQAGITITDNRMTGIAADGITLIAPALSTDGEWIIANNSIQSALNGIRLVNNGVHAQKISIIGNSIVGPNSAGIIVNTFTGAIYTGLVIDNNNISGGTYGIRFVAGSGVLTFNNLSVSRNMVSALGTYGINISQITVGGPVVLDGNTVAGSPSVASFDITNTINLIAQNNVVSNQNVGSGWITAGAKGTLRNNSFDRTPVANIVLSAGVSDLGRVIPNYTPASSGGAAVVQSLNPSEAGAVTVPPSKYVLREWVYSIPQAAWLEQRLLTGN